jgi:citrate synthase
MNDQSSAQLGRATPYLSAREAAELLGVKRATLYAYASRGLVQSVAGDHGRARLYRRQDLERLCARRDARAGHGPVAAAALRFGEPVLDTSITAISSRDGPVYRGLPAIDLARRDVPFEAVAELLWSDREPDPAVELDCEGLGWSGAALPFPADEMQRLLPPSLLPLEALAALVPLLACHDPGRFSERPEAVLPRARRLVRRLSAGLALGSRAGGEAALAGALSADGTARAIARALGAACGEDGVAAIERALVIGADHELNASTFAARVAASTGADIYGCVSAALASLAGPRHGGASDRIEALVAEVGEPSNARRVVHERQRRGEAIAEFGHPLYPEGDPRGALLVEMAQTLAPRSRALETCTALVEEIQRDAAGPNIDVGLVALALALELPRGAAVGIFAVSRCVGWVAHALEQYEAGYLLRPRARYLGPDSH